MKTKHTLINGNCLKCLASYGDMVWDTIFADPPDNIGTKYADYRDALPAEEYVSMLRNWLSMFVFMANTVWLSFNARWLIEIASFSRALLATRHGLEIKPCVQTFTFGQHNQHDLGNNHRPLWRFSHKDAPLFPDAVRIQSWRQAHGDKRADPRGRVPGDVFDFPRVTGNSRQRRKWHPTQINEWLVERCVQLTTPFGGTVLDPFAGTGTTLRVCKRAGFNSTSIELDQGYCEHIAKENGMALIHSSDQLTWQVSQQNHCDTCGNELVRTSENFVVCPNGHGKLHAAP